MGIQDEGIDFQGNTYQYSTDTFQGLATWEEITSSTGFDFQLNQVIAISYPAGTYPTGGSYPSGSQYYWVQDIFNPAEGSGTTAFSIWTNIWDAGGNLAEPPGVPAQSVYLCSLATYPDWPGCLSSTGNGEILEAPTWHYYSAAPLGGSDSVNLQDPGTVGLKVVATTLSGLPTVQFEYEDHYTGTNDNWNIFDDASIYLTPTTSPLFTVNGNGNPGEDIIGPSASFVLCGANSNNPNVDVESGTSIIFTLEYQNSGLESDVGPGFAGLEAVPAAYNSGGTQETATHASSTLFDDGGMPSALVQYDSSGDNSNAELYDMWSASAIDFMPSYEPQYLQSITILPEGFVAGSSSAATFPFSGSLVLTIEAGSYDVELNYDIEGVASSDDLGSLSFAGGSAYTYSSSMLQAGPLAKLGVGSTVDEGETFTVDAPTVTGTSGSTSYYWIVLEGGTDSVCTDETQSSATCTVPQAGLFLLGYGFGDSSSNSFFAELDLAVNPALQEGAVQFFTVTTPSLLITAAEAGESIQIEYSEESGGTGSYSFAWSLPSGMGCQPGDGAVVPCTPTTISSSYTFEVSLSDGDVTFPGQTLDISVSADLAESAPLALPPGDEDSIDYGETVTVTGNAPTGGSSSLFFWQVSDSSDLSCTPTVANPYAASCSVVAAPAGPTSEIIYLYVYDYAADCYFPNNGEDCYQSVPSENPMIVNAGLSLTVTIYPTSPVFSGPTVPSQGSWDNGQMVAVSVSLTSPGAGGETYYWSAPGASADYLTCSWITTTPSTTCLVMNVLATQSKVPSGISVSIDVYTRDVADCYYPSLVGSGLCTGPPSSGSSVGFIVYPDPEVGSISANPTSIDPGDPATFTATMSSVGSGGSFASWSGLPYGYVGSHPPLVKESCIPHPGAIVLVVSCSGVTTNHPCIPCNVKLIFTDTDGVQASLTIDFYDAYAVVYTPGVNPAPPTENFPETFSVSVLYGNPTTRQFTWNGMPAGCPSISAGPSLSCEGMVTGTFTISVTVTDGSHPSVTGPGLTFTIYQGYVATPSCSSGGRQGACTVGVGGTITLTTTARDGTDTIGPIAWNGLPTGCASSSSLTIKCSPTRVGIYTITATVGWCPTGESSCGSVLFSATSGQLILMVTSTLAPAGSGYPNLNYILVSSLETEVGQNLSFNVSVSGSSPPFVDTWTFGDGASSLGANVSHVYDAPGVYTVNITVVDAYGNTTNGSIEITVYPALQLGNISASPTSLDVSQSTTLSASYTGGSGNTTFEWLGLPSCSPQVVRIIGLDPSITCAPAAPGLYIVNAFVNDSLGFTAETFPILLNVSPALVVGNLTPSSESFGVGQTFSITSAPTGGSGTYSNFSWSVEDPICFNCGGGGGSSGAGLGCTITNSAVIQCDPTTVANYVVTVNVNDSNGNNVSSSTLDLYVLDWNTGTLCSFHQGLCLSSGSDHEAPAFTYNYNGSYNDPTLRIVGSYNDVYLNISGSHDVLTVEVNESYAPYVQVIMAGSHDFLTLTAGGAYDNAFVYIFGQNDVYNSSVTGYDFNTNVYFLGFNPGDTSAPQGNLSTTDTYHVRFSSNNVTQSINYANSLGWNSTAHSRAAPRNIDTGKNGVLIYQNWSGTFQGPWDGISYLTPFVPSTPTGTPGYPTGEIYRE